MFVKTHLMLTHIFQFRQIYAQDKPLLYEELLIPALEVVNQIYNWLQQLPPKSMNTTKLKDMSQHQMSFYKHLLDIKWICADPSKKGAFKRIIFTAFHSMLLMLKSIKDFEIIPEPTDMLSVFHGLLLKLDFNEPNSGALIGQLSSILSVILDVFPPNVECLSKPYNGNYDIINMQIEVLKTTQDAKIFQSIIQCWIDIVVKQISNRIDVRYLKQLTFISDEKIYDSSSKYNQKHSLWCHVLILIREILANDVSQCRAILEFITQHEQRLHSVIIQIDQTLQYQSLRQFTAVTGLTLKQIQSYPQSLMLYYEQAQITQLFLEVLLTKNIRTQYTLPLDKIVYTFIGQYSQQLGAYKKFKLFLQGFKPYTELETKLNQVFAKSEPLKNSEQLSFTQQSGKLSMQTPSPYRPKFDQTSIFDGKSTMGGGQKFNPKRDVDHISCFQYICLVEFLRFSHFAIQGIAASMNILDVDRNFQLEDNVWNSFGDNLMSFIHFNLEVFINMSQSDQTNNHIRLHQSLLQNYDFQMQYNGLQLLCVYPSNKDDLFLLCIQNIIYAFCAQLQYLQLRDVHRKINFIKDSYNLEIQLTSNLSKYAETLKGHPYINNKHEKFMETISFGENLNDEANDSYFNRWRNKFEEKLNEYKGL